MIHSWLTGYVSKGHDLLRTNNRRPCMLWRTTATAWGDVFASLIVEALTLALKVSLAEYFELYNVPATPEPRRTHTGHGLLPLAAADAGCSVMG